MATKRPRVRGNAEGSVYLDRRTLKSGDVVERWVAQVTVNGVKRRTINGSEAKAKRALREMLTAVDVGTTIDDGNLTVAQLLDDWQAKALPNRRLQGSTVARHRWACRVLADDLGRRRVRALTPEHVEAAFARRAEDGLAKASITKLRQTLSLALGWAERRGKVARNVAQIVELPTDARESVTGRAMTTDEARAFQAATAGTQLEAMWLVMLVLGCRPGEAAALSWGDVDLKRGVVHVRQALKRGPRGELVVGELKTAHSARSLTAPPAVVEALRMHRQRQNRQRLTAGELWRNDADLVFVNDLGRPLDPSRTRHEFGKVATRAKLAGFTPNHLRHTAASLMSDAGVALEVVADQLGHRDTRMASLHYRHRVRPTIDAGAVMAEVLAADARNR